MYDPNNPFARILRGEFPCFKVYEDAATLAFMDIMPQVDGHTLIIPKEPAETLLDLSPEGAAACILTTRKITRAAIRAMEVPGAIVIQMNGAAIGQTVPHTHFHVMPCHDIGALRPHAKLRESDDKLRAFAARIIAALD